MPRLATTKFPGLLNPSTTSVSSPPCTGTHQIENGDAGPSRSTAIRRPVTRWSAPALLRHLNGYASPSRHPPHVEAPGPVRPERDPVTVSRPSGPFLVSRIVRQAMQFTRIHSKHIQIVRSFTTRIEQDPLAVSRPLRIGGVRSTDGRHLNRARAICVRDPDLRRTRTRGLKRQALSVRRVIRVSLVERRGEERQRNRPIGEALKGQLQIALSLNSVEHTTRPDRATLTSIAPCPKARGCA